jgi:hypothetical protein
MFRSFGNRSRFALVAVVATTLLAVGVGTTQAASAQTGPNGGGQVQYGSDTACQKSGFVWEKDPNFTRGLVSVWYNARAKKSCVVLYKTAYKKTPTAIALVICSTSLFDSTGKRVTAARCQSVTTSGTNLNVAPADWGNYSTYAGSITISSPDCVYVGAFTSTAAETGTFRVSDFKGLSSFHGKIGRKC